MVNINVGGRNFAQVTTITEENDLKSLWDQNPHLKELITLNNNNSNRDGDTIDVTSFVGSDRKLTTLIKDALRNMTAHQLEGLASLLVETSKIGTSNQKQSVTKFLTALQGEKTSVNSAQFIINHFAALNGQLPAGVVKTTINGKKTLNLAGANTATALNVILNLLKKTETTLEQLDAIVAVLTDAAKNPANKVALNTFFKDVMASTKGKLATRRNIEYVANKMPHATYKPLIAYNDDVSFLHADGKNSTANVPAAIMSLNLQTTAPLTDAQKGSLNTAALTVLKDGPDSARRALGRVLAQAADSTVYESLKKELTTGTSPAINKAQWSMMYLSYYAVKKGNDDLGIQMKKLYDAATSPANLALTMGKMGGAFAANLKKMFGVIPENERVKFLQELIGSVNTGDGWDGINGLNNKRENLYQMFFGKPYAPNANPPSVLTFNDKYNVNGENYRKIATNVQALTTLTEPELSNGIAKMLPDVLALPSAERQSAMIAIINSSQVPAVKTALAQAFFGADTVTATPETTPTATSAFGYINDIHEKSKAVRADVASGSNVRGDLAAITPTSPMLQQLTTPENFDKIWHEVLKI